MALTRRAVLLSAGVIGAGAMVSGALASPAAAAAPRELRKWRGRRSDNGWSIDTDAIERFRVEGSDTTVRLHADAAAILLHVARRWHYEISPLEEAGHVSGHRADRTISVTYESNFLSGTAIALHPTRYPLGAGDGMWPHQKTVVRDILADCEGVVRWGGDLAPVMESYFQIDVRPGAKDLARVTDALGGGRPRTAKQRPGAVEDPATPARRVKARRLERSQHKS